MYIWTHECIHDDCTSYRKRTYTITWRMYSCSFEILEWTCWICNALNVYIIIVYLRWKNLTQSTIRLASDVSLRVWLRIIWSGSPIVVPWIGIANAPSKPISSQIWHNDLMHISENALGGVRTHALQTLFLYHTCKLCQICPMHLSWFPTNKVQVDAKVCCSL
jgi:hypothetical protein